MKLDSIHRDMLKGVYILIQYSHSGGNYSVEKEHTVKFERLREC